jgi:hypothetical protein
MNDDRARFAPPTKFETHFAAMFENEHGHPGAVSGNFAVRRRTPAIPGYAADP